MVSSSNSTLSGYLHLVTPLDSVSQLATSHSSRLPSVEPASGCGVPSPLLSQSHLSRSSPQLVSVLSHEDVHSHISLSFYASSVFDQVASLVDTEPRTYYVEGLRSEVDEDDQISAEHFSSHSLTSESHVSLPTFLTPSSSAIFKHLPLLHQDDYALGRYDYPDPPNHMLYKSASSCSSPRSLSSLPNFTEYDEYIETPVPYNSMTTPTAHMTTPTLGERLNEGSVGVERACSDSVQPIICRSLSSSSPPPSPSLPSSPSLLSCSLKDIEPSVLSSQVGAESAYPGSGTFSHRREFEAGFVDYQGRDSFDNIFAHMKLSMESEDQDAVDSLKSTSASSVRSKLSSNWSKESYSDQDDNLVKGRVREEPIAAAGSMGKPEGHSYSHSAASVSGSQSEVQPDASSGKTEDLGQHKSSEKS